VSLFEVILIVLASDLVIFLTEKLDLAFAAPELLKAGLEREGLWELNFPRVNVVQSKQ